MLFAVVNGGLGLRLAANSRKGTVAYAVIAGIVGVMYVATTVLRGKGGHGGVGGVGMMSGVGGVGGLMGGSKGMRVGSRTGSEAELRGSELQNVEAGYKH